MCCPKGKCGCQYFILLTLRRKNSWTQGPGFFLIKPEALKSLYRSPGYKKKPIGPL
jgi:hypothetical protein